MSTTLVENKKRIFFKNFKSLNFAKIKYIVINWEYFLSSMLCVGSFFLQWKATQKKWIPKRCKKEKVVRLLLLDGTLQCIFFLRNLDRSQLEMIPTGRIVFGYMEQKKVRSQKLKCQISSKNQSTLFDLGVDKELSFK